MKKGISLPRSIEFAHKRIIKLEEENTLLSDTLHNLSNETQIALMEKDRYRVEMCAKCRMKMAGI